MQWKRHRPEYVDNQNNAQVVAFIEYLMLPTVIKYNAFSPLPPDVILILYPD